jgi:hypothetical protein
VVQSRGDCPVILSLQNTFTETQALTRLAVLRSGFAGRGSRKASLLWHRAYRSSLVCAPIIGGGCGLITKPGPRMPALPPISLDPSANAEQEGSP